MYSKKKLLLLLLLLGYILIWGLFWNDNMQPNHTVLSPQSSTAGNVTFKQIGTLPSQMIIQGNYLYAICWDELYIIPISSPGVLGTPRNYTIFGGINKSSAFHENDYVDLTSICYYNSMIFLGMEGWNTDTGKFYGISRLDVSNPLSPGQEYFNKTTGTPKGCVASSNTLFAAILGKGLMTMDISDIHHPGIPIYQNTTGYASDIVINGNFAYLSTYTTGLAVFNITSPTNPSNLTYINNTTGASQMYLDQNDLYVSNDNGIYVLDVSNRSNPQVLTYFNIGNFITDLNKKDDYLLFAEYRPGLGTLDVSTPSSPTNNRTKNLKHNTYCVAISGNFAYFGLDGIGISIVDISSLSTIGNEDSIPEEAQKIRDLKIYNQFYLTTVEGHNADYFNYIEAYITIYQVNENTGKIQVRIGAHGSADSNIWDYTFQVKNLQGTELTNYQNVQRDEHWEDDTFVLTVNWETGFIFTLNAIESYEYCNSHTSWWDVNRQLDVITCYQWITKTITITESVSFDPIKERNDKILLGVGIGTPIFIVLIIGLNKKRKNSFYQMRSNALMSPNSYPSPTVASTSQPTFKYNPQNSSTTETYKKPKSNDDDTGWN